MEPNLISIKIFLIVSAGTV